MVGVFATIAPILAAAAGGDLGIGSGTARRIGGTSSTARAAGAEASFRRLANHAGFAAFATGRYRDGLAGYGERRVAPVLSSIHPGRSVFAWGTDRKRQYLAFFD